MIFILQEIENENIWDTINKTYNKGKNVKIINNNPIHLSSDEEEAEILKDISKSLNKSEL